jgi:fatty acid desaturase
LRDLETPAPWIYWTDLLTSSGLAWVALVASCAAVSDGPLVCAILAVVVSGLAFYRAAMFVHEISHLRAGTLPGFALAWNGLVGVPLLLPSFMYRGIHKFHHRAGTYGTARDPEYVPFAGVRGAIVISTLFAGLLPIVLAVRFLVAAPLGLLVPRLHRCLECRASALAINVTFMRVVSAEERQEICRTELIVVLLWGAVLAAAAAGLVAWHVFAVWYTVTALACVLNHVRALAAHRYDNHAATPLTRCEQLRDSIDTPGGLWTELWAPVGTRYHALHHCFPRIPYHNLPAAYRRLHAEPTADAPYPRTCSAGLWPSLRRLWQRRKEDA